MGIVFLDHGFGDRKTTVIFKTPFSAQLTEFLNSVTDSTAKYGELLLQIRKFNFVQTSGGTYSKRYCYIRAEIYSMKNDLYQQLAFIDTLIITKSYNATKKILKDASLTISNFIANNLVKETTDSNYYSLSDILKIDSIEKQRIFVYTTSTYSDGLYLTYKSFMNQTADKQITAKMSGKEISSVKTSGENGKPVHVKAKEVYAIVYNGQPFIATEYGYFQLKKINDDFIFTSKAKATANNEDVMVATLAFGIIGGILASNVTGTFEMKIDHVDGKFIILRQIKDNPVDPGPL